MYQVPLDGPFAGLKLIDTDSHFSEPVDLWTSRAPAKFKDLVPQVHVADDGIRYWYLEGFENQIGRDGGASVVKKNGDKFPYYGNDLLGTKRLPRDEMHAAAYDPHARVEMLDDLGIYAQVVYPNVLSGVTPALVQTLNRELAVTIIQIYNDAIAEWQEASGGRLYPQAVLPFWDIEASVRESVRVKEMGLTGVTMAGEPHLGGLPDLGQPAWNPLYEVLSDLELPIDIHIGARNVKVHSYEVGRAWESLPGRAAKPVRSVQTELANSRFVANMVASDILIRYPKLNWVSVESGIGWIPYVLERIDYEYREEYPGVPDPELPSAREMFQRGLYATFWFEETGPRRLIDAIGEDHIMWETDFPHPTCLYPSPVERSAALLADLEPTVLRKIMQDNAAQLYGIPL